MCALYYLSFVLKTNMLFTKKTFQFRNTEMKTFGILFRYDPPILRIISGIKQYHQYIDYMTAYCVYYHFGMTIPKKCRCTSDIKRNIECIDNIFAYIQNAIVTEKLDIIVSKGLTCHNTFIFAGSGKFQLLYDPCKKPTYNLIKYHNSRNIYYYLCRKRELRIFFHKRFLYLNQHL